MKEISLHIMDIAQNSISAKASLVEIRITESPKTNQLTIEISDNGKGMDDQTLMQVTDPYFTTRTTRRVGLGIPLFMQAARQAGGTMQITSSPGNGTTLITEMQLGHIDLQPLGDIAGVISLLVCGNPEIDFIYTHKTDRSEYKFDSREVKKELGDLSIAHPQVAKFIKEMIRENLETILNL